MTPAQIKKALELLNKRRELILLRDRYGQARGEITKGGTNPLLVLKDGDYTITIGVDVLEHWVKQAKKVQKMGILD